MTLQNKSFVKKKRKKESYNNVCQVCRIIKGKLLNGSERERLLRLSLDSIRT